MLQLHQSLRRHAIMGSRAISFVPQKGYHLPESLEDTTKFLSENKPTFTMLYFHAKWNPYCEQMEADYDATVKKFGQFTHIKVDSDLHPRIKYYYDARVEPHFLMLVNGGAFLRVTGFNFEHLHEKMQLTLDTHNQKLNYYGATGEHYEDYTDEFETRRRNLEMDRDHVKWYHEHENK